MVKLAVHQKPLHQVDVFLAGSAGAAEHAALDHCGRLRLVQLVQVLFAVRGQGGDVRGGGGR